MLQVKSGQPKAGTNIHRFLLGVDALMLILVMVNMLWLIFDWLFGYEVFRQFVQTVHRPFFNYYSSVIHPNFLVYDLWFVAVYVAEFLLQWVMAVARRVYKRWYIYPVLHWYDILGCIPVVGFRWLRLLRVAAILIRLQRMGVIDMRHTYFYKVGKDVYEVILEEITDRVFATIIDSVKREVMQAGSTTKNHQVEILLASQKSALAKWVTHRIQSFTRQNYEQNIDKLRMNIDATVSESIEKSNNIDRLMHVPLIGKKIVHSLEKTLSDSIFNFIDTTAQRIYSEQKTAGLEATVATAIDSLGSKEKDEELDRIVKGIITNVLDQMKADVMAKSWKEEGGEPNSRNSML